MKKKHLARVRAESRRRDEIIVQLQTVGFPSANTCSDVDAISLSVVDVAQLLVRLGYPCSAEPDPYCEDCGELINSAILGCTSTACLECAECGGSLVDHTHEQGKAVCEDCGAFHWNGRNSMGITPGVRVRYDMKNGWRALRS